MPNYEEKIVPENSYRNIFFYNKFSNIKKIYKYLRALFFKFFCKYLVIFFNFIDLFYCNGCKKRRIYSVFGSKSK